MKTVYILRGLPGSGKTTLAQDLVYESDQGLICSADSFFIRDGKYKFDPSLLGAAHLCCFNTFMEGLKRGDSPIVVDNTNTRPGEWKPYADRARKYGYVPVLLTVDSMMEDEQLQARNVHGVPLETIKKMRERLRL